MTLEQDVLKLIETYSFEARRVQFTRDTWLISDCPVDDTRHSPLTLQKVADDLARVVAKYYIENHLDASGLCREVKTAIQREKSRSWWAKFFDNERQTTSPKA